MLADISPIVSEFLLVVFKQGCTFHREVVSSAPWRRSMMGSREGELVELVVFKMFTLEVSGLRVCLNIVNPTENLDFCKSKIASNFFSMHNAYL